MKSEFQFGKVTYKPGAPKNLPRWVWRCACGNCSGNMSGPTAQPIESDVLGDECERETTPHAVAPHRKPLKRFLVGC
jgi:hypothetical protein